jgi:hypothetical protein
LAQKQRSSVSFGFIHRFLVNDAGWQVDPPRNSLGPPDLGVGGFFSFRFHLCALQQLRREFLLCFPI